MADVKIFVVTEGVPETVQQLGLLNKVSQQQLTQSARFSHEMIGHTGVVHTFNRAVERTNRALGAVGLAGQFLGVNSAALAAANAINSVATATASPKLARAAGVGGILATIGAFMAGAVAWRQKQEILRGPQQTLSGSTDQGIDRVQARVLELGQAGKLTADQFAFFRQELERINKLQDEGTADALGRQMRGEATAAEEAADALAKVRVELVAIEEKQNTKDEASAKRSIEVNDMALERARMEEGVLARQKQMAILEDQELAVQRQAQIWSNEFAAGRITEQQAAERSLETQKKLLDIDLQRQAIKQGSPWGSFGQQMQRTGDLENIAVAPFAGAFEGVSTSIQGLINLTMTWGDALRNISTNIIQSIIKSFADMVSAWVVSMAMMVARWVFSHVIMKGVLAAFHFFARLLGWQSTQSQIAQESAKAPSLAMNAATASVSSYGASAVVGMVLALAALGAIIGFALGAFEQGGYTGGGATDRIAGVVHGQEFVFDAPAVQRIGVGNLERMRRGEMPEGGSGRGRGGGGGGIYLVDNRQDAVDRRLSSSEGEDMVMEIVGRNAHKIR